MYQLSIIVGNASIALLYESEETLKKALVSADDTVRIMFGVNILSIDDDFGQIANIVRDDFHGFVVEDLSKSKRARAEQMVHNARCQAEATKLAKVDRSLTGGPSVLTPQMGQNGLM